MERHPERFQEAKEYEKTALEDGSPFTWSQGESLDELSQPQRIAQIKAEYEKRKARAQAKAKTNLRKMKVLGRMAGNVNTHLDAEKRAHEARVSAKQKLVFDRQERARCAQHVNMSSPHGVTTTHSSCLSVSLV